MADLIRIMLNLPVFGLVLCRSAGIMLAAPVFSSVSLPIRTKAAFVALLSLVMYPFAAAHAPAPPTQVIGYVPIIVTELGLGLIMGLAASMVIASFQVAGAMMSQQIGLAMARIASPDTQVSSTAVSVFLGTFGLLLFLAVDGHHWFVEALAISYRDVPIGGVQWSNQASQAIMGGFSKMFLVALKAAAPVMGIMFILNVLLALLAKTVPEMNILLIGYPIKVFVGMTSLVLTFPFFWPVASAAFRDLQMQMGLFARLL